MSDHIIIIGLDCTEGKREKGRSTVSRGSARTGISCCCGCCGIAIIIVIVIGI